MLEPNPIYGGRITPNDTVTDAMLKLSEGNPGAISVLARMLAEAPILLAEIDSLGLYGADVWVAYKDHCQQDFGRFCCAILNHDSAMLATVEEDREASGRKPMSEAELALFLQREDS